MTVDWIRRFERADKLIYDVYFKDDVYFVAMNVIQCECFDLKCKSAH